MRLASLLWRLRRATTIETGLFEIQADHLSEFRQARRVLPARTGVVHRCSAATRRVLDEDRFNRLAVRVITRLYLRLLEAELGFAGRHWPENLRRPLQFLSPSAVLARVRECGDPKGNGTTSADIATALPHS